jgi:hypothetical protein
MQKELLGAALVMMVFASPVAAQNFCLRTHDIVSTDSKDGKTLVFKLRDGRTLVNHLRGICPGLKFNGFAWVIRGSEEVCENEQTLRVLQSGEICMLGKFAPPVAKPKAN